VRESAERRKARARTGQLGGIVLALQSAALSEDVLLLCDNEAVLCAIKKWVGQGGKSTLATAPDADILREIVCLLTQRVRAGRATFLIKVKSHRGEPITERADTLAEEGREISDDDKRWDDRTDRMTFAVRKGNTTVRSVWTNSVRNAFRKQAARAAAAKHWTERVWYCHNQRWLQVSRAGTEASQSGSFKDEQDWGKKCFEDLDHRRMGRPVTRTWSTDILLREGSSREEMGKWREATMWKGQQQWLKSSIRVVQQIVFVGGTCGSVYVESFNDPIRKKLVRRLLEEQDKVLRSYFAQKGGARSQGGEGIHGKGREHVKWDMYA
jgi:ribonuclease HI